MPVYNPDAPVDNTDWIFDVPKASQTNEPLINKTQRENPNTSVSAPTNDPYEEIFGSKPTPKSEYKPDEGNYLNSFLKGAARVSPDQPFILGTPTNPDQIKKLLDNYQARHSMSPQEKEEALDKELPSPKTGTGAAIEGVGGAAVNPLSYAFGPAGIASSAISGGVTGWRNYESPDTPVTNAMLGIGAGALAPVSGASKVGKYGLQMLSNGLEHLTGRGFMQKEALDQARRDLGVTGMTSAGAGEEHSTPYLVKSMRESPLNRSIENAEYKGREQLKAAFDDMTNPIGVSQSREQAGTVLKEAIGKPDFGNPNATGWVNTAKREIGHDTQMLNRAVDPQNVPINTAPILAELDKAVTPVLGAAQLDPASAQLVDKIKQGFQNYAQSQGSTGVAPLSAISANKQAIGDMLSTNLFSQSDATQAHLTSIWNVLNNAERQGYAQAGYGAEHDALTARWKDYFEGQKAVKDYIQKDAGPAFESLMSGSNQGGEKLSRVLNIVPGAREELAAYKIRQLGGMGTPGQEFDPKQFVMNWADRRNPILSPEAKQALFGPELTRAYDKLALVAREQVRSEAARNTSGTSTVREFWTFVRNAGAVGAAYAGADYAQSRYLQDNPEAKPAWDKTLTGMAAYATAALLGPKLLSNPTFVRFIATNPPVEKLPFRLRAIAANNPDIVNEVTAFQNYITSKYHLDQSKDDSQRQSEEHHFAEGGRVFERDPNDLNKLETDQDLGYLERQKADKDSLISQIMRKYNLGETGRKDAETYADELRVYSNPKEFEGGYAEGGIVDYKNPFVTKTKDYIEPPSQEQSKRQAIIDQLMGQFHTINDNPRANPFDNAMKGFAGGGLMDEDKILSQNYSPSYGEGEKIPPNYPQSVLDTFIQESQSAPDKFEREKGMLQMMKNRENLSPVWPHTLGIESYAGGGYAEGGEINSPEQETDPGLKLIMKYESAGGKNIHQQVVGPKGGYNPSTGTVTGPSSAQGYFQMIDPTWRTAAKLAGIDTSIYQHAMEAPYTLQRRAAIALRDKNGYSDWAPYNAKLAAALNKGEIVADLKGDTSGKKNTPKKKEEVAKESVKAPSIIDQFLTEQEEPSTDDSMTTALNSTIQNANWLTPTTKFAANEILTS